MEKERTIIALDAMRGLAAIVVALGHFFFGFAPEFHGLQYQSTTGVGAAGTPMFAIFNGSAAVVFFFVLSGFVLSLKPLQTGSYRSLGRSALKRWPRLAGPVFISCVIAAALGMLMLYRNHEAAALTGSHWLDIFNFRFEGREPNIADAIKEGALLTFVTGSNAYNAVLWTMWYEFLGSFIVFSLVAFLIPLRSVFYRGALLLAAWWIALSYSPFLSCFIVGIMIALFHIERGTETFANTRQTRWISVCMIALVIIIWGYQGPYKFYEFVGAFFPDTATSKTSVYTVSAIILMILGLYMPLVKNAFSNRSGTLLGQMSFPIYLIHLLVICSLSSWLYITLYGHLPIFIVLTFVLAVTVIVTAVAAWALSKIDMMLTHALNRRMAVLFIQENKSALVGNDI